MIDFQEKLAEQLALLADACGAFDAGKIYQVKSISARLYVICHDLARVKRWHQWTSGNLQMLSTAILPEPDNLIISHHPLAAISLGSDGPAFSPHGSQPPPYKVQFQKFSKWWEEMVLRSEQGRTLTRKNIVFQMRSYDGGSHGFEKAPNEDYQHMRDNRGIGWIAGMGDREIEFRLSALEATTRQIAHELLYSLVPRLNLHFRSLVDYDVMWSPHGGGSPTVPVPEFAT